MIITNDMLKQMMGDIRKQKDELMIEAICRTIGHSDWKYDEISKFMHTREYPDKSSVFSFKGRDMLLFEPPVIIDEKLCQPVQYLYDKTDFKYMTYEERADLGYFELPADDEETIH